MEKDELLRTLETLHRDLSTTNRVDPEAEMMLRAVTDDIHRLLKDEQEPPREESNSLASRLRSLVRTWEADHPQISRVIGQVADALSNIGI